MYPHIHYTYIHYTCTHKHYTYTHIHYTHIHIHIHNTHVYTHIHYTYRHIYTTYIHRGKKCNSMTDSLYQSHQAGRCTGRTCPPTKHVTQVQARSLEKTCQQLGAVLGNDKGPAVFQTMPLTLPALGHPDHIGILRRFRILAWLNYSHKPLARIDGTGWDID